MTEDRWARWLLRDRHGGDSAALAETLAMLAPVRDRVLDAARIEPGDRVLDVGCGDGLLGFGALDRTGADGTVVFSDVSAPLLDRCRQLAAELDSTTLCEFVHSGLPELAGIPDASVDVAMTRSVLIYLTDKAAGLAGLFRVLRPGGRLSIFEPINRFACDHTGFGYDVTGCERAATKVWQAMTTSSPTLADFDERDLLAWAGRAGFTEIRLSYEVEVDVPARHQVRDWAAFLNSAPNPNAPTLGEAFESVLTPAERDGLIRCLRPQVEAGSRRSHMAYAYLSAVRPL